MFKHRAQQLELIDDPNFPPERVDRTFRDMARLNRALGGYWAMVAWLRQQIQANPGKRLKLADLGCGNGDFFRHLKQRHPKLYEAVDLIAVDENSDALGKIPVTVHDKQALDLMAYIDKAQPDLVVLSLVTHHIPDDVLVELVSRMNRQVQVSWLVVDLHRHPLSWLGLQILPRLFFMEPAVIHDGPLSVRRGFSRADWQSYLAKAGHQQGWRHALNWKPLFRWKIEANRD